MKRLILILTLCVSSLIGDNIKFISLFFKSNSLKENQKWQVYTNDIFLQKALNYLENPKESVTFKTKKGEVKVPPYKRALTYLEKSINYNNPIAASIYLFLLDTYTTKNFIKEKNKIVRKAIGILMRGNLCDGYLYYKMIAKNKQDLISKIKKGLNICEGQEKQILLMELNFLKGNK